MRLLRDLGPLVAAAKMMVVVVAQAAVDCGNVRSLPACRWIPVQIQ